MVDSGTRYALAIWRVVRPPTARRVSATAEDAGRAGWQARKSSRSVSSLPLTGPGPGSRCSATSRRWRAVRDLNESRCLRQATVTSHANGSAGASSSQCRWAASSASWTASSADAKSAPRRTRTPRTRGPTSLKRPFSALTSASPTSCPTGTGKTALGGRCRDQLSRPSREGCRGTRGPRSTRTTVDLQAPEPTTGPQPPRAPAPGSRRRCTSTPRRRPWSPRTVRR